MNIVELKTVVWIICNLRCSYLQGNTENFAVIEYCHGTSSKCFTDDWKLDMHSELHCNAVLL